MTDRSNLLPARPSRRTVIQLGALGAAALALRSPAFAAAPVEKSIPQARLRNGVSMPMLGFGTYSLRGEVCAASVADAINAGYRLIDTAKVYENEEAVGEGIRRSGIDRKALFVTSKLWVEDSGYGPAKQAFNTSLKKLGIEYLDLYLIHRPRGDVQGSWRAMEELNNSGRIRSIGVSNFTPAQLSSLLTDAKTQPSINQIETHPFFQEGAQLTSLHAAGAQMEAWAPFAEGRDGLFSNPVLLDLARQHGRTVAQVVLRWHLQRGVITIPRSSNPEHRRENLAIFDFTLLPDEVARISALDKDRSQFPEWT